MVSLIRNSATQLFGSKADAALLEQEPVDCLCYLSKASAHMNAAELNRLLTQANEFNRTHNITGVLFYWRQHFFQYIEGPSSELQALLARIELDSRHEVINTIHFDSTNLRRFSDWAMMRVSAKSEGIASLVESVVQLLNRLTPNVPADASTKSILFGLLDCLGDSPLRHSIEHEIVGKKLIVIGASAGGITAIKELLNELPKDIDASILIVTHLAPNHKTVLHLILERECGFSVQLAEDGDLVLPGVIHLIPPSKNLEIIAGRIRVSRQKRTNKSVSQLIESGESSIPLPIDILLKSSAKQYGRKVVGIILSGSGHDGTAGARALQEAGGIVLAQTPDSAEFPSMPQSVIDEGLASRVLHPTQMSKLLTSIVTAQSDELTTRISPENEVVIDNIIDTLAKSNVDFSSYKRNTIVNRILRRKTLLEIDDLEKYQSILAESDLERLALINDLLICVTSFFRDALAWEALKEAIIAELLPKIIAEHEIRVWVAGCATGEEAYSTAILLNEIYEEQGLRANFKIFATDLSENSLDIAREGVYKSSLANAIDKELQEKYFYITADTLKAKNFISERIIWVVHNLANSPPFTNMHIVSCRNVIIYMNNELQEEVLQTLHFALLQNGLLFLGPSESTSKVPGEFQPIDRKWNIHKKKYNKKIPLHVKYSKPAKISGPPLKHGVTGTMRSKAGEEHMYRKSIEVMCSVQNKTALIVGKHREVDLVISDSMGLLEVANGQPEASLEKLLVPSLVSTVIVNLQQLQKLGADEMTFANIDCVNNHKEKVSVDMQIFSLKNTVEETSWLLTCEQSKSQRHVLTDEIAGSGSAVSEQSSQEIIKSIKRKDEELAETRQVLFETIKELEKSKHEQEEAFQQLTTANEELQSTNEELQSVNEELYTVNFEYQSKIHELSDLTNDLDNLMQCTEIGVVYVSPEMTIRRLTDQAANIAGLLPSDIGSHISVLATRLQHAKLEDQLSHVMSLGKNIECDIEFKNVADRLHIGIYPYKVDSELAQGAIITLLDLADLKTFSVASIDDNDPKLSHSTADQVEEIM